MSLMSDFAELSRHLQQERLFVTTEREQLQRLFEKVRQTAETLLHVAWIAHHQKTILSTCMAHGNDSKAVDVCGQSNELEKTIFVDSYKCFSHHDSKYGDMLKFLWENPTLLGHCVWEGEKTGMGKMEQIIATITSSVYCGCMFREDEAAMLQILKLLTELQVANDDNPRRLLRRGNCSFSLLYKQLCDSMFSARLFLTAALHDPIMRLLMEDEWFYDIDPSKALVRFPPKERQKRFGDPGTEDHRIKQLNYRTFIVDKLVQLSVRFISSIKANLHCFPPALAWLVAHLYSTLTRSGRVDTSEVRSTCADLVFALFICPAICDPEPYGITSDIPISHIARHNLMQIAQIIQVLAISRWDEIDSKVKDLYSRFEKGTMSSVLDMFLEGPWDDVTLTASPAPTSLPIRTAVLMTSSDIKELVSFLRLTIARLEDELAGKKQLEQLLATLPQDILASPGDSSLACISVPAQVSNAAEAPATPPVSSGSETPGTQRKLFKTKGIRKKPSLTNLHQMGEDTVNEEKEKSSVSEDVLVITVIPPADCPGMIPEKKVLAWEYENRRRKVKYPSSITDTIPVPGAEIQEKRTRFSLSHDQESIGNTSDCQEAISEAASSHSVDENELDNFSDMMSANVSGRGSPSISGRDTPLSQAESVEENHGTPELPVPVPETVQKQNRVDVTDRFGKFDLERDEIKSTVSDTWSTDVLASDSEPPDQNQLDRLEEVAEEMIRPFMLGSSRDTEPLSEISETASDAWSTDVLASDTDEKNSERLKELDDQDDVGSIVDRDEADSTVGQEEDSSLEALGAVGGAANLTAEDLAEFGDMYSASGTDIQKQTGEEGNERSKKHPSALTTQAVAQHTSAQSLHPPQFHRPLVHSSKQESRQSDPQQAMRRVWKERHSEERYNLHSIQQSSNPQIQQQRGNITGELSSLGEGQSHRTINPGINIWVNSNGQISGDSTSVGDARIKTQAVTTTNPLFSGNTPSLGGLSSNPAHPPLNIMTDRKLQSQGDFIADHFSQDNPLIEITEALKSLDHSETSETLIDIDNLSDQAEALTLSEQQNTRLDENRLSTAFSMFDPFASEADDIPLDSNNSNQSAKAVKTTFGVSSPAGDNLATVSSRSVDSAIELLCEDDSAFKDLTVLKPKGAVVHLEDSKDNLEKNTNKNSTTVVTDAVISSHRDAADNISVRSDEKDFHDGEDTSNKKASTGFFRNFRDKLHKGIKRKTKMEKDYSGSDGLDGEGIHSNRTSGEVCSDSADVSGSNKADPLDDILAKYRNSKKGIPGKSEVVDASRDSTLTAHSAEEDRLAASQAEENTLLLDPANLESCFAFQDAKRKLRLVLSVCEVQPGFYQVQSHSPRPGGNASGREHELVYLLKAQLAEAINLQNKELITRLHEVIRCVKLFDSDGCKKLLKSLREEYRNRAAYISYLVRCRQGLLAAQANLQKMLNRIERDKQICSKHLISVCVRLFIERHERQVIQFISQFQKLAMSDEKTDLVEKFLQLMYQEMSQDRVWRAASEIQLDDGRAAIERLLMSRIYIHAMFPNGDGDIHRDQVIQQHIKKLSAIITPTNKYLRIPRIYHFESPWPAAQRDIFMINAYKTPKDKLKCVLRCSQTIMNLLSMANEKSVPAADDFMPVLIFVIIKANPPCLLSTIQYVESFYVNRLHGEEQYWWLQFSSAVEFIKTMDYSE